jgi:tetratricopeptide (TPR) repeat protein
MKPVPDTAERQHIRNMIATTSLPESHIQPFSIEFTAPTRPPLESASRDLADIKDWCLARADEWYERGEFGAARDFLKQAADVDPRDARVWVALGSLHYQLGEFERAGLAFVKAGELAPADDQIFLHLALTHQQLGQDKEAEALFKHAIALQPDPAAAGLAMGLLSSFLFARERYDEARDYVEGALEEQPDHIDLLMRLGVCCFKTNDRHAAQACFERVLKLDPENELARENLAVLKNGNR